MPPRKSQGFKALSNAGYVSNSPFKQSVNAGLPSDLSSDEDDQQEDENDDDESSQEDEEQIEEDVFSSPARSSQQQQRRPQSYQLPKVPQAPQESVVDKPLMPKNAWALSASLSPKKEMTNTMTPPKPTTGTPTSVRQQQETTPTSTPRRRMYGNGTPIAATDSTSSPISSPTKAKSLLVNHRLHGPRSPSSNQSSPSASASIASTTAVGTFPGATVKMERRKTVTFDELLDVQEFELESTHDGSFSSTATSATNATQSSAAVSDSEAGSPMLGSDAHSGSDHAFVQAATSMLDEGASPELGVGEDKLASSDDSSDSSRDFSAPSTVDSSDAEGETDLLDQESVDRRSRTTAATTEADSSSSTPATLVGSNNDHHEGKFPSNHRKTIVTELEEDGTSFAAELDNSFGLLAQMRNSHSGMTENADQSRTERVVNVTSADLRGLHRVDSLVDELLKGDLLGELSPTKQAAFEQPDSQQKGSTRPLPQPPVVADDSNEATPTRRTATSTATMTASGGGGRPHISRNTVLERVASQKSQSRQGSPRAVIPAAAAAGAAGSPAVRSSQTQRELAASSPAGTPRKTSDPVLRQQAQFDAADAVEQWSAADMDSATSDTHAAKQLRHQSLPAPAAAVHTSPVPRPEALRRDSLPAEAQRVSPLERVSALAGSPELAQQHLAAPTSDAGDDDTSSIVSGRVSPSLLGPAPAHLTPAQRADLIIARRRSKNGKPPGRGRRSLSTGDAGSVVAVHAAEQKPENEQQKKQQENVPVDEVIEKGREEVDGKLREAVEARFGYGIEREISRIYKQSDVSSRPFLWDTTWKSDILMPVDRRSTMSTTAASSRVSKTRCRTMVKLVMSTAAELGGSFVVRVTW